MTLTAEEVLATAKVHLQRKYPYFSAALAAVKLVETRDPQLPTMAVDKHWRLYYNRQWIEAKAQDATGIEGMAGVLVHEVIHLLRHHASRGSMAHGGNPKLAKLWHVAIDAAVNQDVRADGLLPFPASSPGVFPEDYGLPANGTAEEYFAILHQRAEEQEAEQDQQPGEGDPGDEQGDDAGPGGEGEGEDDGEGEGQGKGAGKPDPNGNLANGSAGDGLQRPWEQGEPTGTDDDPESGDGGLSEAQANLVRHQVAAAIRSQGNAPGSWKRWAEVPPETVDIRSKVRAAAQRALATAASGKQQYTYARVRRNGEAYQPFVMPGVRHYKLNIAVIVDTSGSMGDTELGLAMAGIADVTREYDVTVYASDTYIRASENVFQGAGIERLREKLVGGGGTDMAHAINQLDDVRSYASTAALRGKTRPDVIVCLTDGYTGWPSKPTSVPLLIVLVANGSWGGGPPTWAKVIRVKE